MSGRLGKRPASPPPRYQTKEAPLDGGVEATAGLATHPATLPGDRSNGAGPAVDPEPVPMALLLPTPDGKKMKWTLVDDDTPPETRLAAVASISKKLMPTPINSDSTWAAGGGFGAPQAAGGGFGALQAAGGQAAVVQVAAPLNVADGNCSACGRKLALGPKRGSTQALFPCSTSGFYHLATYCPIATERVGLHSESDEPPAAAAPDAAWRASKREQVAAGRKKKREEAEAERKK